MIIIYKIDRLTVVDVCIENNLYTAGTNEEYDYMLSRIDSFKKNGMTAEEIVDTARDIKAHSRTEISVNQITAYLLRASYVSAVILLNSEE